MAKLQLHFNGNFSLKKEEVARILQAATEEKGLNDSLENLMNRTSLGNAKVGRIKSWASRAGLVQENRPSPEGEIVWRLDRYFESYITSWLMHFYLSFGDKGLQKPPKNPADWGGWCYFIFSFLPQYNTFTVDELLHHFTSIFEEESKIISTRIKYILRAYTENQALASCKFLTVQEDKYSNQNATLPNPYLIGYFLAKLWERDFGDTTSVLTDDILQQKMGLAPVLAIETEALQECLNQLETLAIVEQRRTVSPAQIIRRWTDPLTLLEKAYTEG
ncbi:MULTISPECIES: DUF4007 family protein [Nostocales]|uniref:DUF4007 family protein n=2 Tax=Nostocales TaxID=1161 RepID=A0A8S9T2D6_9CYAN|nr:DUF4007 family protein [Tolypothrix bouteillei]KAF3886505.1 DUF4007 family protein [Tolypothrix bouteillei VB521301]